MGNDILQVINILLLIGLFYAVFLLVSNSGRSAKALEDIAKNLDKLTEKK